MNSTPYHPLPPLPAMAATMTTQEQQLCQFLRGLSDHHAHRYTEQASKELLSSLFWCMAGGKQVYMDLLFPTVGGPSRNGTLKLREAQGAIDGAEYTEGARGYPCGHIFRAGEATYSCKTCGTDDTCCLCSRCFDATDHRGHMVRVSVSPGNSGCCDCGDHEAWKTPMYCTIHSRLEDNPNACADEGADMDAPGKGKGKTAIAGTPPDLEASIRMTIGRVFDFMCDVISCSPEQLRNPKTEESILQDEKLSRLSEVYGGGDDGPPSEYTVLLWNDEKHTVNDVQDQVARACQVTLRDGRMCAYQTDEIGRTVLKYSGSVTELLKVAKVLEEIKITVTIRSARETFREQMCSTIIEWLCDISGCSVGQDADILRRVICEELLRPWNKGSHAANAVVGKNGITDEAKIAEEADIRNAHRSGHDFQLFREEMQARILAGQDEDDDDEDDDDDGEDDLDIFISAMSGDEDEDDDDDDMMDGDIDNGDEGEGEGDAEGDDADDANRAERQQLGAALMTLLTAPLTMDTDDIVMVDFQQQGGAQQAEAEDQEAEADRTGQATENDANEAPAQPAADTAMAMDEEADWQRGLGQLEQNEATMAGYPAPPLPPAGQQGSESSDTVAVVADTDSASTPLATSTSAPAAEPRALRSARDRDGTPSDSDTAEPVMASRFNKTGLEIPKTPGKNKNAKKEGTPQPGHYWLDVPPAYELIQPASPAEDLFQRVRLDWLILFDLRLWKKVRNDLRSLYISTVINIPEFKRVLGLRFAGLYTSLAQLYLIGDREPDHSIINISLQMLTAASITTEIVERGNFLTSLMSILYTFLTTRQVGHPWQVLDTATLTFDSGSVTNRRMYHFFVDLKYLFQSPHVQECLRTEDRYMMQFLDLVKLHQGICPNTRAVGEHIEYETDTWISASLITREINRLCRQFSDAFRNLQEADFSYLAHAIRYTAKTTILSAVGAERLRFTQAEIQDEIAFHNVSDFEFEEDPKDYNIVSFVVDKRQISFHHALHYTLSWLIECGKSLPVEHLRTMLSFETADLRAAPRSMGRKLLPKRFNFSSEDYLMAAFDYPLRVCAWLAQMKANMWVRNGISLRHQAGTYRGVSQRDVAHHRDIFLMQTALVICDPSRVLVSIIDRFGMERWVKGIFEQKAEAQDDLQHLDVVEDMIHLLIVLISDRMSLIDFGGDETAAQTMGLRRDIAHVLCFKPLSYTDICNKLPDRYQENENFQTVLEEMTTYKAPEGNSDIGTFELDPRFIESVDPYSGHYNKNQREESETAYRKWMAKKTGQPDDSIVYEPKLHPITSGVFMKLAGFTSTGVFAQLIYYSLLYTLESPKLTPTVKSSRIETYTQVLLHLVLIAISEDGSAPESPETQREDAASFIRLALLRNARHCFTDSTQCKTIAALLITISSKDEFRACHPKVSLILRRMRQKRPADFEAAYAQLGIPIDQISTGSPAYNDNNANEEREKKKRAALDRQARVMAQFQEQQKSFLANQGGIDWGISDEEEDELVDDNLDTDMDHGSKAAEEPKKIWKYPGGTCILCQEETDDRRLYGTFALFTESLILRQTDLQDSDFVREAASTPKNLDRSAESIRPFGVAHENRQKVEKIGADGERYETERQVIGKGFPSQNCKSGTLSVGCGHIMHHHCFEAYFEATLRRHQQQIARHHPEDTSRLEFVCPLCKALGNAFLPIVWKGKEESYPGALAPTESFQQFLDIQMMNQAHYVLGASRPVDTVQGTYRQYVHSTMVNSVVEKSSQLLIDAWESLSLHPPLLSQPSTPSGAVGAITPTDWISPAMVAAGGVAAAVGAGGAGAGASRSSSIMASVTGGHGQPEQNMVRDLVSAYNRLRKTLRKNKLPSHHSYDSHEVKMVKELFSSDTLVQTVGYSISAVEIQQRGTDAEYGMTLLTKITEQNLTHLRIMCETVTSYIATGVQRAGGDNRIEREYRLDTERQHCQLFIAQYMGEETELTRQPVAEYAPLLSLDPFVFLCECVFGLVPSHKIELSHVLRMCYLAEIVKVVYYMARNTNPQAWIGQLMNRDQGFSSTSNPGLDSFAKFCLAVSQMDLNVRAASGSHNLSGLSGVIDASLLAQNANGENRAFDLGGVDTLEGYYNFVQKYALVFLRKSVVLLYAAAGVDFNSHVSPAPELPELDRLTEALRVPTFDEMCNSLAVVNDEQQQQQLSASASAAGVTWSSPSVRQLVTGWVQHVYLAASNNSTTSTSTPAVSSSLAALSSLSSSATSETPSTTGRMLQTPSNTLNPSALLSHPGIYELVGLPENFEQLLAECTRVHCPTTGKDVSEPTMCLMCGEVFCSQATCCAREERIPSRRGDIIRKIGGAQQHMRKCQRNIGLFLNIRKCCIFYLHRLSGSFGYAPYIDKYGEVDMGFRHGRPLLLNQRRYDSMLRAVWLGHGIPSFISRRLEMDINNGGWETI
ncbi:e3 ubiquitin-protein ligase ubr1 [Ophiostoma piceae UAMH 11346]|uniref:E3 ubiquitin-protein ligase n=1 Tax=Ophiostoma piceae (strain UAMH 11346) TaxID=1262450 RepID=S3C2U4_OPHP1|nr:e3 ubiquitin-protein ligase ubr1 [Ophiostoma piceae UAMH 11346]